MTIGVDIESKDVAYMLIASASGVGQIVRGPARALSNDQIASHLRQMADVLGVGVDETPEHELPPADRLEHTLFRAMESMPAITATSSVAANQKRARILAEAVRRDTEITVTPSSKYL